jgi:hypothetical protein
MSEPTGFVNTPGQPCRSVIERNAGHRVSAKVTARPASLPI